MAGKTLLNVNHVTAIRDGKTLLDKVSFSVSEGEFLAILGRNGSGKSTLMSLMTGLRMPSHGDICFSGQKNATPQSHEGRSHFGVVFQNTSLDKKLTACENLHVYGLLAGLSGARLKGRIHDLLVQTGLLERAHEPISKWSGGMRRKLDLMRALLFSPRILFLDEPTAGLDLAAARDFWGHVHAMREKERMAIVAITHTPEEALCADQVLVLHQGLTAYCGGILGLMSHVAAGLVELEIPSGILTPELKKRIDTFDPLGTWVEETLWQVPSGDPVDTLSRLARQFPPEEIRSLRIRRASLGDAVLKLTGESLS